MQQEYEHKPTLEEKNLKFCMVLLSDKQGL